ncbi:MAG: hypothetical protein JO101_09295 [Candidatus Eremiobacteraeota bacterium]|nr:hypothetical protein [Candidatus Eremiobacteraeota bacterium]MBV8355502.1 hypothetical protein [Candidatus Eremiobacteraeota bacterium]
MSGPPPAGTTWEERGKLWLTEQQAGRRLVLIAEDGRGLAGTVQIVFRLPEGYNDPEAANGADVAMMEMLRMRAGVHPEVADRLVGQVQDIARKKNITTLTFVLPVDQQRGITQAKSWGFEEFRLMPEKRGMLAFFRKAVG